MTASRTLAVDVGGSDLKLVVLDRSGRDLTEPARTPTPRPATPQAITQAILAAAQQHRPFDRVAVGFPGIVVDGVAMNAPNLDGAWDAVPLGSLLEAALQRPVRVANDADVAGLGVVGLVPGAGQGVELVLTLGTGMGSALFVDSTLVPNLELGQHSFAGGRSYEGWLGKAGLAELGVEAWRVRVMDALMSVRRTFSPRRVYLGGGNARLLDPDAMPQWVTIVGNRPGLVGGLHLYI